ncbi:MAG: FAM210A/B-like domain-containing protein [Myxococcaceae bacterium]
MEKPTLKQRLKAIYDQYGKIAIGTYLAIFVLVWAGFYLAVHLGVKLEGTAGAAGTVGIAYAATKVTQPVRILATLVATPLLAKLLSRRRPAEPR